MTSVRWNRVVMIHRVVVAVVGARGQRHHGGCTRGSDVLLLGGEVVSRGAGRGLEPVVGRGGAEGGVV